VNQQRDMRLESYLSKQTTYVFWVLLELWVWQCITASVLPQILLMSRFLYSWVKAFSHTGTLFLQDTLMANHLILLQTSLRCKVNSHFDDTDIRGPPLSFPSLLCFVALVYQSLDDWATGWVIGVRFPAGIRIFFCHRLHTDSGSHPASCAMSTGPLSRGIKRKEREADH
jgi:hypothetical protein